MNWLLPISVAVVVVVVAELAAAAGLVAVAAKLAVDRETGDGRY